MTRMAEALCYEQGSINLETLDAGYSRTRLSRAQQVPAMRRLMQHLQAIPGVLGVSVSEKIGAPTTSK